MLSLLATSMAELLMLLMVSPCIIPDFGAAIFFSRLKSFKSFVYYFKQNLMCNYRPKKFRHV